MSVKRQTLCFILTFAAQRINRHFYVCNTLNLMLLLNFIKAASENPKLCVALPPYIRRNARLPCVNSAFVSVASLDFGVFGGCQKNTVFLVVRKIIDKYFAIRTEYF